MRTQITVAARKRTTSAETSEAVASPAATPAGCQPVDPVRPRGGDVPGAATLDVRKDASLDALARSGNVAQFVSFSPVGADGLRQEFCRITGYPANHRFPDATAAIAALLGKAPEGTVNVRSYEPGNPRSRDFVYGLATLDAVMTTVRRLRSGGLHLIVNETVDVKDGGVSGVMMGRTMEFSPDDTPRCVEKPGLASLPIEWGMELLQTVYGFRPELPSTGGRLEFSIHPRVRGWKSGHTLAWEYEGTASETVVEATRTWPNNFSRMIGDKAFGLLMAELAGLTVPKTLVFARRIAPFFFGAATGSSEIWIRTCPHEPEPGLYTTRKGWCDPFALLAAEDPDGAGIASVLAQSAIPAVHSGAALLSSAGELVVEGRAGEGDGLMMGRDLPEPLPEGVLSDVAAAYALAAAKLGPVRFEWVHDGARLWVV